MSDDEPQEDLEDELESEVEARRNRLQALAEELKVSECLDSVVIIATYHARGWTQYAAGSAGNSFSACASTEKFMLGMKKEWES